MKSTSNESQNKPVINHIAVYVLNLQASTHFYEEIIGLEIIPEPFHDGRHTWFSVGGNAALHIIEGATSVEIHSKDSHLCFSVSSMEKFIPHLKQNDIAYESALGQEASITTRPDGVKQIYFADPDGYWIEINDAT